MTDRQSWTPLDDAILPLSSHVSFTSAGYVGEVVDWRGQLVWASEPQSDEVAADGLASSQKDAFSAIRRVRAQRGMSQPFSPDLTFLPAFVRDKVLEAARLTQISEYVFVERTGIADKQGHLPSFRLQIGNHPLEPRWVCMEGWQGWLEAGSGDLRVELIHKALRPQVPNPRTFWLLYPEHPVLYVSKLTLAAIERPDVPRSEWGGILGFKA